MKKFRFPHDVQGWLSFKEGEWLSKISSGKNVLEVGSFCGRSTICIAQTAKRVVSVDTHKGDSDTGPADTLGAFRNNLLNYGVEGCVDVQVGDFRNIGPQLPKDHYEVIFIDACHKYDSVKADIATASLLLKQGGIWVFHDYKASYHEGVKRAVNEFFYRKSYHRWTADSTLFVHT